MCQTIVASSPKPTDVAVADVSSRKIPWSEVKKHSSPQDGWLVHSNKVYDVSNWYSHPGGGVIFTHAGDDCTDIFAAFHAQGSMAAMKKFQIGTLQEGSREYEDPRQEAFEAGYRKLRTELVKMGMFKSSKLFYIYKCSFNMAMWASAVALVYFTQSTSLHFLSACILGMFWQQSGWLAHDFLHHQVFATRSYGDLGGIYWGNLMQGYSMAWWKNKHNGHHAVPNLHNSSATSTDGDPDIDTMPLLAWSIQQARSFRELSADGKDSAVTKFFIRHQALTYFPILLLARLSWLNESFKTAFGLGGASENARIELKEQGLQHPILEKVTILLHWAWVAVLCSGFGTWSIPMSVAYFLTATCGCGLFLALVFGLGHNGMATYDADARPDFWKLQVSC